MISSIIFLLIFNGITTGELFSEENIEFNHPNILPQHPSEFRKIKQSSNVHKSYITKERLPNNLSAKRYELYFKPYFPAPGISYDQNKNFTFDGRLLLTVQALVNSDRFIINAYNFKINSYNVVDDNGANIPINSISQDDSKQQLSLITNSNAVVKNTIYHISIIYTGLINSYLDGGVYYTSYTDTQGVLHYMLATHMEPFSARKVFPSLDEPSYKANFVIILEYPTSQTAISNMMETTPTDLGNGWSLRNFPETPIMSSYLIAFAVGPYVNYKYINRHNTTTRAWGWPGTENYLQFAAENAGECLYQLGEYTGIKFPLEKADQLGMPEFLAGAMENWGLIIYKYQYIAYNPQTMTTRDKEAAAKVMCHELAHQWFGDLVTTAWWDDLFLNEGFADYFMTFIQKSVYPDQATYLDSLQVLNELQTGLNADISSNAHPLVYPEGPAFDDITYQKGASMLRMLSDVLGPDIFREAIQKYLNKMQYSNANNNDLFSTFTEVSLAHNLLNWCQNPLNVTQFMQPYIHQTNFPLIQLNNLDELGVTLREQPFGDTTTYSPYNYTWNVPIQYLSYDQSSSVLFWVTTENCRAENRIEKRMAKYSLGSVTSATYGRLHYDDSLFKENLDYIQQNVPDNLKLTLLTDEYYYMIRERNAGRPHSYDRYLDLAKTIFLSSSFFKSPSYSVFAHAQPVLEEIANVYRDTIDAPLISRMYNDFFNPTYIRLLWEDTNNWETDTFSEIFLPWAVRYDIENVQNVTLSLFRNIKVSCRNSINGSAWCNPYTTNLRKAIYCGAAKFAPDSSDFFFTMIRYYNQEVVTNPYFYQEYMALLEGMACSRNAVTLRILIRLFVNSTLNKNTLFGFLKSNPVASDSLYDYLINNPQLVNSTVLKPFLDALTYNWNTAKRQKQFTNLIRLLPLTTDDQISTFNQYKQRIVDQQKYRQTHALQLLRWLYDNTVVKGKTPWEKTMDGTIKPDIYSLTIQPFIPGSGQYESYLNMTFQGFLTFNFTVTKPTSLLVLNAHRLNIEPDQIELFEVNMNDHVDVLIDTAAISKDFSRGLLYIPTGNNYILPTGEYQLQIEYSGFIFQNASSGASINTYYTSDNNKGWIFTTDFEGGPGVRTLLPCIDEPSYKANFLISVKHAASMVALSNGLETQKSLLTNGWMQTTFEVTKPMSSYLLAICVGHFSSLSKFSQKTGKLVRVWTWNGMEAYSEFSLNVTIGTLEFMTDYLGAEYELNKLDLIALPQYTQSSGAMENFGLIIGRFNVLLFDPDYAQTSLVATVAETIAHEVVHQWFGDSVTMDWWNDIFLNEGFAQYFFANGVNYAFPDQEHYTIDYNRFWINQVALSYDCSPQYSKPVISDQPPVFGIMPYYKGSALLNLLSNLLSPDTLQFGLRNYYRAYKLGNANADALWSILTDAATQSGRLDWNGKSINVSDVMRPYTLQTSFPVVTLDITSYNGVNARQSSCLKGNNGDLWNIPVYTYTSQGSQFNWFINGNGGNSTIWQTNPSSPYRVDDIASSSFGRVMYDDQSLYKIQQQLISDPEVFTRQTRAMILDDAYEFYRSGAYSTEKFMNLTLYLTKENALGPWSVVNDFFLQLADRFKYQPEFDNISNYIIQVTKNAFDRYGFNITNKWANNQIANEITYLNCYVGNQLCFQKSSELFKKFVKNCANSQYGTGKCAGIGPDLRTTVYCYGLRESNNTEDITTVQLLYAWFVRNSPYLTNDRVRLLHALGCETQVNRLHARIEDVIFHNYPTDLLYYIATHDQTGRVLFDYFTKNSGRVLFASFDFLTFVDAMVMNWSTNEQLSMLQSFASSDDYKQLNNYEQRVWKAGISYVQNNIYWMKYYKTEILLWIERNFGSVN